MNQVRHHSRWARWATAATIILPLALAACAESTPTPPLHAIHSIAPQHAKTSSAEVSSELARLRARTASFHRFESARAAGWSTQITPCFSNPAAGGMGYHYGNTALIDGTVDPMQPELLLYEPRKNGELRFVAVEFIVPFDAWTKAEPPMLFGQTFHRNESFGLWVLHVWHFDNNPNGTFADWNPNVSCAHAGT